jgi:hypothetical protein
MKDENGNEIVEVNEGQQTEINDIIENFIPPVPAVEEPVTPVEPVIPNNGDIKDGEEGKEQQAQATSGQEQVIEPVEKGKAPVEPITPVTPVEPVTPVAPVVEKTPLEIAQEEIATLRAHMEEMAGKVVAPPPAKPLTPEEQQARQAEDAKKAKQVLPFLASNDIFDDVMKDVNNFNALLTSVVNTAVERSLRLMPQVAGTLYEQRTTLGNAVSSFYKDNADLEPHKKYVGFVANEVSAQHPDWGLKEILQETEKEVRNRLKIARVTTPVTPSQPVTPQNGNIRTVQTNPGFVPGGGGGRKGGPASADGNLTGQEKQIMDIL